MAYDAILGQAEWRIWTCWFGSAPLLVVYVSRWMVGRPRPASMNFFYAGWLSWSWTWSVHRNVWPVWHTLDILLAPSNILIYRIVLCQYNNIIILLHNRAAMYGVWRRLGTSRMKNLDMLIRQCSTLCINAPPAGPFILRVLERYCVQTNIIQIIIRHPKNKKSL
jgi:hypothetical protein